MVSSYFFYKNGKVNVKGNLLNYKFSIRVIFIWFLNFFKKNLANFLPFKIWAIIYPYKSNLKYFTDTNGKVIVDQIFIFEKLEFCCEKVAKEYFPDNKITYNISKQNQSNHNEFMSYYNGKFSLKS